jgi:hypothetical protein
LYSKCEALRSNPSQYCQNKRRKEGKRERERRREEGREKGKEREGGRKKGRHRHNFKSHRI